MYPDGGARAGQEGRTIVRIEIDSRGFPVGCTVLTSSNSEVLDATTCRIAQTRLQIGLDADGNVTSCKVVEQLPAGARPCAGYPIGKAGPFHATRDGAASAALMTVVNRVYLDQP